MTTSTTPDAFRAIFRSLVIRAQPRHLERDAVDEYWTVLNTIPLDVLRQSAIEVARRQTHFPSTSEWFQAARDLQVAARATLAAEPENPDVIECEHCSDTGWVYVDRGETTAVVACGCRATNHTYQRKQATQPQRLTVVKKDPA